MQTQDVPKLNPKDLFEKRVKRDASRLRAYNQLLSQIHQRIYTTAQMSGNANHILYTVPPFIFGLPKIDLQDCVVYLVYQLRQSGYEVRFTYPNMLFISWKHHEHNYLVTQNPILQAMIPPEVKKAEKKKALQLANNVNSHGRDIKQVSFQSDLLYKDIPQTITQQTMPVRSAAEYQPPNSFLQTMQKPLPERQNNILADLWAFN